MDNLFRFIDHKDQNELKLRKAQDDLKYIEYFRRNTHHNSTLTSLKDSYYEFLPKDIRDEYKRIYKYVNSKELHSNSEGIYGKASSIREY